MEGGRGGEGVWVGGGGGRGDGLVWWCRGRPEEGVGAGGIEVKGS